jgi:hypothetical protein
MLAVLLLAVSLVMRERVVMRRFPVRLSFTNTYDARQATIAIKVPFG